MYNNSIVDKILKIIKEDKNQPEFRLENDLIKLLDSEISDQVKDAYDQGYEACKTDMESDYYYKR